MRYVHDQRGVAAIEFAFILPVLILLVFGAIEFGYFFLEAQRAARVVDQVARELDADPADPAIYALANQYRGGGRTVCLSSHPTMAQALSNSCSANSYTLPPPSAALTESYIEIIARKDTTSLSGLIDNLLPKVYEEQTIRVNETASGCSNEAIRQHPGCLLQYRAVGCPTTVDTSVIGMNKELKCVGGELRCDWSSFSMPAAALLAPTLSPASVAIINDNPGSDCPSHGTVCTLGSGPLLPTMCGAP